MLKVLARRTLKEVAALIRKMIIHKSKQRNKTKKNCHTDSRYAAMTITRYGPFVVFKRGF